MNRDQRSTTLSFAALRGSASAGLLALILLCLGAPAAWAQTVDGQGGAQPEAAAEHVVTGRIDAVMRSAQRIIIDGQTFGIAGRRQSGAAFDQGPAHARRLAGQLQRLEVGSRVTLEYRPTPESSTMDGIIIRIRENR